MFKDTLHTEAHFVLDPHMEHVENRLCVDSDLHFCVESDIHFHCCASNNGMLTSALSIVVRQTMACWRQHFPLLWSNNGMLMSALSIVCLSTQRLTSFPDPHMEHVENRLCVESDLGKMMFWSRNPDLLSGSSPKFNGMVPWVAGYLPENILFQIRQ